MKRFIHNDGARWLCVFAILFLCHEILYQGHAWGFASSGLRLSLHPDAAHEDLKYILNQDQDPIKLVMVIRNETPGPIATDRGFSQEELHHSLIVIDPGGNRHELEEQNTVNVMHSPYFVGDPPQPWLKAEMLPVGWVRSVTIEDLREFVPMMRTTPGWYTIEAQQPFIRFEQTGQDAGLGLLGWLDEFRIWKGTVNSEKMQIYIYPGLGAQPKVRILDDSADPPTPLGQVPVRVFHVSDLPSGYNLSDVWDQNEPALNGTTGFDGWAVWNSGTPCIPKDNYTTVAFYSNEYKESLTASGEGVGWATGCTGLIEEQIVFGIGYQPKMYKQQAINFLSALLENADKKDKKRIDKAITSIHKSLGGDLWEDDSHLTKKGQEVFDKEKQAVKELMKVKHLDVTNAIDSILSADELLAQTAIDEAITAGGDQKEIDKANKEMYQGRKEIDKGKYDKAIDHYKKAWEHAQKAL